MRTHLFCIVMAAVAMVSCAQHPEVAVIGDFEGETVWEGVQPDSEHAREGKRSGLWVPKDNSSARIDQMPHDWSNFDRLCLWLHSQKANGQRLTLVANSENEADDTGWDYFFYHFTIDWSGWKYLSLGFGQEIRPTRKPVGWHKIDYLSINAGGWQHHPLDDTVLRLDGVKLVRDPARLERTDAKARREGGAYAVSQSFRLTKRAESSRSFPLRVEGEFELFEPQVSPVKSVQIGPEEERIIEVKLVADEAKLAEAEPLTRESGKLIVDIEAHGAPDISAEVSAAVPLPPRQRPLLMASPEEIQRAKRRAQRYDWAKSHVQKLIARGDAQLDKEVDVPEEGGQWSHHYVCDTCGVGLKTESPTKHVCPECGKVYTGWPYDQVYVARLHHALTRAVRDLGLAYAFTEDQRYARKARDILLAYGRKYRSFPLHNSRGHKSRSAGRLYAQTLDEAVDIIPVAWGYDLIYDSGVFSDEDRQIIEDGYFRGVAEVIKRNDAGKSNWQTWHNAGLAAIGFCLRDAELAALAINGPHGLRYQLQASVLPDGFWYEGTAAYHFYALQALRWTVQAAYHSGIDFYDNAAYQSLYDGPLYYVKPDLTFPAVNDSDVFSLAGRHWMYELAYARFGDERYVPIARQGHRTSLEALLWGVEKLPSVPPLELSSRDFEGLGAAILRNGTGGDGTYLHLDYGPHGGGHGHPDKLTMILYALGAELAPDPGRLAYGAPLHGSWYRQTVAHNTVCVDQRSQRPTEGRLTVFADGDVAKVVQAECDTAYDGVTMRRTMALTDSMLIDVFEVRSEQEHTYDWLYHNIGEMTPRPATEAMPGPLGEAAGYQHISDVHSADGIEVWHADFDVPDAGSVRLMGLGEPGTELYFGNGLIGRSVEPCPMVVVRRNCRETVYVSAIEWCEPGAEPTLQRLRAEPALIDGQHIEGKRPLAVRVEREAESHLLLLAEGIEGNKRIGEITSDADICYRIERDGRLPAIQRIDLRK